jgi:mannitol-1-phosphate 5-dehydrogenase
MSSAPDSRPVAVQFGGGNIGRGFMGELFAASGYHVTFIDVDRALIDAVRARGAYEVHHISTAGDEVATVRGVSAIDARDADAVAAAVDRAAIACTAVGVRALKAVVPALAAGLAARLARPDAPPLNIITCENLVGAGRFLRDLVWTELERLGGEGRDLPFARSDFEGRIGFVEAVVSRMVPIVPEDVKRSDPLWIACEPYARLPVDGPALRGPVPQIAGLVPVESILAHQRRKLACHNMSHALCAYLGYRAGHEFIWQAMDDPAILAVVRGALAETGRALISRFGFKPDEQRAYEDDLLERYRNRALGDQVRRVGADPLRKLGPEDRLIGSARLCLEEGVDPAHVILGIRAALAYDHPGDPSAVRLQQALRSQGLPHVLRDVCGLRPDEPLFQTLMARE